MTEPAFSIRAARRADCRRIAELYRISSDGVADYIWTRLAAPDENILDVGERRYARDDTAFSYRNCRLIELDDTVVGMLSAFPLDVDPSYVEEDPVLVPYSKLEEDESYYVCGLAIDAPYRGRGLGTRLMDVAQRDAVVRGYEKMSLIVFEENIRAKTFYDGLGYREVDRHPIVPHPLIRHTGDALLMVKPIGGGPPTQPA